MGKCFNITSSSYSLEKSIMVTWLNDKEYEILENLKTKTVNETAGIMGISSSNIYATLYNIRNKDEKSRGTVNFLNNLKNSANYPRLGKLLRRAERKKQEKEDLDE